MARGKPARSKAKSKANAKEKARVKGKANVQGWAPAAVKRRKAARRNDFVAGCAELWAFCTRLPVIFTVGIILGVCLGITAAEIDELRHARGPTQTGPIAANDEAPQTESPSVPSTDMAVAAGQSDLQITEPKATEPEVAESSPPTPAMEPPESATAVPPLFYSEETEPDAAPDMAIPAPARAPELATAAVPTPASPPAIASAPLPAPPATETPASAAAPSPEESAPSPAIAPKPKPVVAEPAPPLAQPAPPPQLATVAPPAAPASAPAATPAPEPAPDLAPEPTAPAAPVAADAPAWLKNAVASIDPGQRPMIAIVLDDVGVAPADAELALKLPGSVTLSIMTYAPNVAAFADRARIKGHEIMVHMPMEPVDHSVDPGPNALLVGLTEAEIRRRVIWGLSRFDGYVGVNNHMGSRFTQYEPGMRIVMEELKSRGLLFLDSRTIAKSVGDTTAASEGVTHVARDVFLDNTVSVEAVLQQLKDAEAVARAQGYVVAIGHPHPTTVAALKRWIPEARKAGFALVPLSEIVKKREGLAG